MNGAAGSVEKPLIDRATAASGVRRLLMLGGALILLAAALAFFGHTYGGIALLVIFGCLAAVGIAAIFGAALGVVRLGGASPDGSIARDFLDTARTGTMIIDRRGQMVYANRAYGDITGAGNASEVKTLERLLGREPEAREAIYYLANLARESRAGQREFRLARSLSGPAGPDSAPRWYRISVRPLPTAGEAMQAWQVLDITADRKHEESSFQDLQHAIDYLDKAPAGFFASDANHRIAYINATLADWLGLDLGEFRPFARSIMEFVSQASRPLLRTDTGGADTDAMSVVDLDLITASGRSLPVRLLRKPVPDDVAAPGTVRTLVLNRSGESEAATPVEVAEARFTRFFNSSPMAIAALDETGRVVRSNAAFRQLFGSGAANGEAAVETGIRENGRESLRTAVRAAAAGKAGILPVDAEIEGDKPRSVRIYVSAVPRVGPEADESAILYGVDITEQRVLEEQFAKSQRMQAIGNLAGGIAHDFNNVLTIITASVDFLLLNHRTGDPSFQDLLLIKQSANRAASLVRQLLAYSRRQTMRPKMLNLTDVVADMHLLLKRVSGDHATLERQHARDLWPVMADIGQFEQVITNLVQNARDAMPDGGKITISTRNVPADEALGFGYAELTEGDYVLVEVADTGTGMPSDVAERIFEPFFTTKEIGKGTGLGLSMVYGIVKQSGGFIFVDSTLGKGTTFRIFLPRHVPTQISASGGDTSAAAVSAKMDLSGTASILLVEDEDHVRAGNVRALKMRGYDVHEAASGQEAMEILEEVDGQIDLVVSDVVMPEMDGPTLLKEMRKTRPDLKFIFVSGYAEDAFAKNLPEGEKFGFLAKPFSLRDLAVAVKTALDD
ncbi:cell cycle histidine kinase CckA [Aurantimonas sp. VKM B-3413]|uniref:cell cycle histidine kinase CckA n=1 Tax=Aurantimonas sp. VKM B-3413 TaxID=2779401 RepID=UPI001E58AA99|nr:PAS domain-containing sensor histidine kinase [Aurantimonas sp. VKM B-3413]MCB8838146.1 response regulator [Aurantimonas sp. VKM B-3413]